MISLSGQSANAVLFETLGPRMGINKFIATSPNTVTIRVIGTGEVKLQSSTDRELRGVSNTPNGLHSLERYFPASGWTDEGNVESSDGETEVEITIETDDMNKPVAWRLVVVTPGNGNVIAHANWY